MSDVISHSDSLKEIAEQILIELNLLTILNQFGEIRFTGSYAADIMINCDIDLYLTRPSDINMGEVLAVHNSIFKTKKVKGNILLGNNFDQTHPENEFPKGYYLGIKTWRILEDNTRQKWKIDIWFVHTDELSKVKYLNLPRLINTENKELILNIKKYVADNNLNIPSVEIYDSVFRDNCLSLDEFIKSKVN